MHHVSVTTPSTLGCEDTDDSTAATFGVPPRPPVGTVGVGVVAPYDFALDRELWRWVPEEVTLHLTRTPFSPLPVTVEQAQLISGTAEAAQCTADLMTVLPQVVAFACTSGSFVAGRAGERALTDAMVGAGAPTAVTTSGALLDALAHLGITRLGTATPYDAYITARLGDYLREAGVTVTQEGHLGLSERIWRVPYAATIRLVREVAASGCQAVFVSCTNLPTYDIIAPLEVELGIPILTANQVTMWAALRHVGVAAVAPGQRLVDGGAGAPQGGRA